MKKIAMAILIMILLPVYCLAQEEGSFAIIEWNTNKVVVLDFSGNVLFEKDFNGIGVCYFISPSLGGWLVKGCLNNGCQGEDWILWQLQPDGSITKTITGLGPGPFYTGITSGNFITGNVYTGIIDLRNGNGTVIDSINVWEEENGWPFDYSRLGDTAGLVSGGFVVPPEGGWPRSSASYAPYLYYYDANLNLTNKVDISSENIRLFNLVGVADGGFAGTCADYGSSERVESLCWFDAEGGLIEKVDVTGDLPNLGYMNYFIAGLSDGRVLLTVYGHDKVWMYDPPSENSDRGDTEATSTGQMAANYPKVLDLSRSGISGIGAIAGNTFAIDSDTDGVPDVVDNCPNDVNVDQADIDGDGIGNICDSDTATSNLAGTKWDVFVISFFPYSISFGGATVNYYAGGEADISWDNPEAEILPFSYCENISFGDMVFFTIDESGWGMVEMDISITMIMFGGYHGYLNYVIVGVPKKCAQEGEMFSLVYSEYPDHCCIGLTEWYSGMDTRMSIGDTCYATVNVAGAPVGTCINCGNGICEEIEDVCNCEQDCAGGLNSDYSTIDEFCSSEWNDHMAHICKEWQKLGDYPICDLCK